MMNRVAVTLWNLKACFYHVIRSLPFLKKILHQEINGLKRLIENVSSCPISGVDIGIGSGSTFDIFPDRAQIVGLDRSFKMIRKSKRRKGINGVVGNAVDLPFRNQAISFISTVGLTEYLFDKKLFLDEISRVICSDGHFLVTIAPPGLFNYLRNLLGHRIYPIRSERWETEVAGRGFVCIERIETWLQHQYLFVKKKTSII